ncbi:hypothetical protein E4U41_007567 [Claviceps citrina]|nr:hypothetical protein E4U41_007567 [Claviceps citrina]
MDTAKTTSGVIRPVGPSGKFNTSRHHLGLCRCVVVTGRYSMSDAADEAGLSNAQVAIFRSRLPVALAKVIDQHPMLRVGISNEGAADPAFIALRTVNLERLIEWKEYAGHYDTGSLARSLEAVHDQVWQQVDSQPPWKVVVHQPTANEQKTARAGFIDVSFAFHHAIADAQSALIFHRHLAEALNSNADAVSMPTIRHEHILSVKPAAAADLPGPLEDIVPFKSSWLFFLGAIFFAMWSKLAPSWLKADPSKGPWGGKKIAFEPFKTGLSIFHVPEPTVSAIVKACRERGTTLTPLLHALVLRSLSSRLDDKEAVCFRAGTPISLRRVSKPSFDRRNTIHCMVTSHSHDFAKDVVSGFRAPGKKDDDAMIWAAADGLGRSLRAKVASLPRNDQMSLLGLVSDWQTFWTSQLGTFRKESWTCSNAGSLRQSDPGSRASQADGKGDTWVVIDRLFFTQGALPASAAFHLNVVGVEGKGVTMSLTFQQGVIDAGLVDAVAKDVESCLAKFASSGRFY